MSSSGGNFKMFKWVPDGTYDYGEFLIRYVLVNGNPTIVINKDWIDRGAPNDLDISLHQPWGTFPDFPPKPKK